MYKKGLKRAEHVQETTNTCVSYTRKVTNIEQFGLALAQNKNASLKLSTTFVQY